MASDKGGMIKEVRSCTASEDFDLGGYSKAMITELVQGAFKEPLPSPEAVRLSFVIGGGKNSRQKYRDAAGKDLCQALQAIGFNEDRAASECLECQGSYKYQHDTGKNVKVVHVFPHVSPRNEEGGDDDDEKTGRSPLQLCVLATIKLFKQMVRSKVPSFAQKRNLLKLLKQKKAEVQDIEDRCMRMERLTQEEQDLYDQASVESLEDKCTWVKALLEAHVFEGILTKKEVEMVRAQLQEKDAALSEALAKAKEANKAKRIAKLEAAAEELKQRLDALKDVKPVVVKSQFDKEMRDLKARHGKLVRLENKKGLRTAAEVKLLCGMEGLEERIATLEGKMKAERGWFA